jgi:hypothetical protein
MAVGYRGAAYPGVRLGGAVDMHGHVQVSQVVFMLLGVAFGVALITDSGGLASRMLEGLRGQPVTGRLYARMPNWLMRGFGVWAVVAGVGQFFLLRYLPS